MTSWSHEPLALRSLAEAIARETGVWLVNERRLGVGATTTKSTATDLVTFFDREAERRIVARLQQCRPGDAIFGEEGAAHDGLTGIRWLIDPIDGTTNFVYDLGGYAISIAAHDERGPLAGAVYVPASAELFSAHRGGGAYCDGQPIAPTQTLALDHALVGTGFGYDAERRGVQARRLAAVLPRVRDVRRLGAASLDLCLVACGRLDAYYEDHLQPWDIAAGVLIAQEAGCSVSDFRGHTVRPEEVLASTPALFEPMIRLLDDATAGSP